MYVYKITNIINQKVYIGITSRTIEERFKEHKYRMNERIDLHLYSSMKKHGVENFKVELLESCDTLESLFTQERFWISKTNSNNPLFGYNNTNGGEGFERVETDDQKILELYKENRSYIKTAELLGYSDSTVRRRLHAMGEELDRGYSDYSEKVIELYTTPYTIDDICKILNLSNKTVIKILNENSIERHGLSSFPDADTLLNKYKSGISMTKLAKEYDTGRHRISRIIKYKLKI